MIKETGDRSARVDYDLLRVVGIDYLPISENEQINITVKRGGSLKKVVLKWQMGERGFGLIAEVRSEMSDVTQAHHIEGKQEKAIPLEEAEG